MLAQTQPGTYGPMQNNHINGTNLQIPSNSYNHPQAVLQVCGSWFAFKRYFQKNLAIIKKFNY